ncbi:hypothetical protein [Capnocytophaga sp. oral taxon 323]|jgi:hypothetical protein|uniref:hypothetical protein n=1 Tax=Capnocytophaga sp. oral taxon 323 TaxID=1705617 RepID=UPI0006AF71A1|nr:hypothetical protein [Capnocytophaga sp. oral taxon 323]ALC98140.1 hypothetical protein AM608_11090 [Capnocytophaga sp. oral taxon 323]
MTGKELQEAVNKLCLDMKANLPGFLYCGILNSAEGTIIAKASSSPEFSTIAEETAPVFSTIVAQVKSVVALSESLNIKEIHSTLIETNKITYVIGISNLGKFFILLALDRDKANLTIARSLVEKSRPLAVILDEQL